MIDVNYISASDFCDSVRDGTHDTPKQTNSGYKLVTSKHIKNGQINSDEGYYISEKDYHKINERSLVEQWDVLMSMIGTIGEAAIVKVQPDYAIKNVALFKCGVEQKAKWLYYYLCSSDGKGQLFGNQKGASQQFVSLTQLRNLRIPVLDNTSMIKTTEILSVYDDLIENYQKQIKLLEEAAMRLYREWFVNLRFPGYETTKIVDGIPEGWHQGRLRECIEVNPRSISKNYAHQQIQYIDIGSVNRGRIEQKTRYKLSDAPGRAKRIAVDGDTIWGMVRPNLMAYALVLSPDKNDVFSSGFSILSPRAIPYTFLYCCVTQDDFVGYLVNCTNGSAYPAVKPIHFEEAKILIPETGLLDEFHRIIDPVFRKVKTLETQNSLLLQTRDSLLPRLMNGEIEV